MGVACFLGYVVWVWLVFRYWTKDIRQWFEVTMAAEEDKQTALRDTMRTLFNSFSQQ